jgi:hypothetical protein
MLASFCQTRVVSGLKMADDHLRLASIAQSEEKIMFAQLNPMIPS